MPRPQRANQGGIVYHVLNRANARACIFDSDASYEIFEQILGLAVQRTGTRLLSYCAMPNHWHLVLWPQRDGELSECLRWLTVTHTNRWHSAHGTAGTGHVYQGRFKSFPVQDDRHLWTVCRYVERNALRARLVKKAESWRWGSAWRFLAGDPEGLLSAWPESSPTDWLNWLNVPQTAKDLASLRQSVTRGRPFGEEGWVTRLVRRFGLACAIRPRDRPRKADRKGS